MTIKSTNIHLSRTLIETGLWHIERYLMERYGCTQAAQDMAPLKWYIGTGRASVDFIKTCLTAKPFMIGRKLHQGGTYDEVIRRLKDYLDISEN